MRTRGVQAAAAAAGSYLRRKPANSLGLVEQEQLRFRRHECFEDVQEEVSQVDVVGLPVVHKLHLGGRKSSNATLLCWPLV